MQNHVVNPVVEVVDQHGGGLMMMNTIDRNDH